jgi:hypothetical protein
MGIVDRFKRDLGKNRGKAAVLGVLFVGMVATSLRAVLQLRAGTADASVSNRATVNTSDSRATAGPGDAAGRIRESQQLWQTLQRVNSSAIASSALFTFDGSFYPPLPPDLSHPAPVVAEPAESAPQPVVPAVDPEALKLSRIRKDSQALVVRSTVVGTDSSESMTIINQQLLQVGQSILGFEITAIREREVEFQKEGVAIVVRMPDGPR